MSRARVIAGRLLAALLGCWAVAAATGAQAAEPPSGTATFALLVGVNRNIDGRAPDLRYADDDAARYLDLFRSLGARAYLLADLDENTRRLHPQALAEALPPRGRDLDASVQRLAEDVAQARSRGVKTAFYFVYAGHGSTVEGRGYLSLADGRLTAEDIGARILDRVRADESHLIVDACYSAFLVMGRGPGGERRALHGFSRFAGLASRPDLGLLLSTSSARESHEWGAFEAGVFSHEVRSGLYGAADADGDGLVSYREIAAFVDRANAAVPAERFRPDVFARPPVGRTSLLDLRGALGRRLEIDGARAGHYLVEDARGVRLADFHHGPTESVRLLRPAVSGRLYLRRVSDGLEYVIPAPPAVVRVEDLIPAEPRVVPRGAAHEAFERLFQLAFTRQHAHQFAWRPLPETVVEQDAAFAPGHESLDTRAWVTTAFGGTAVAAAGVGVWSWLSARDLAGQKTRSQQELAGNNQAISRRNRLTATMLGLSGGAAAASLLLWLWPRGPAVAAEVAPTTAGTVLGLSGRF